MEQLTELKRMLFTGKLEITRNENEHASGGTGWLAIDGGDGVLALLKWKASKFGDDVR